MHVKIITSSLGFSQYSPPADAKMIDWFAERNKGLRSRKQIKRGNNIQ
jgi:hypothetical protein